MLSLAQTFKYLPLSMQDTAKNLAGWIIDALFTHWATLVIVFSGLAVSYRFLRRNKPKGDNIYKLIKEFVNVGFALKSLENTVNSRCDELIEGQKYLQSQINLQNEAAHIPIWRANSTGQCIYANEAYCRFFDMDFSELRGDGWLNTVADSNLDKTLQLWTKAIAAQTQSCIEYDAKTKFGVKRVRSIFYVYVGKNGFVEFQGSTQLSPSEEIKERKL